MAAPTRSSPPQASTLLDDTLPSAGTPGVELARGTAVGRYLVLERVASGSMGVVYAAYDPKLHRKIALKVLRPDIPTFHPREIHRRFLREAEAMARLSHPNVVPVHDVGTDGDRVFLAMEFIEGQTLSQWLSEKTRSWREIRAIFLAAGRGLAAAHDAGLVHGDFKPANVLVGTDGRVCVTDFGLAHHVQGSRKVAPFERRVTPEAAALVDAPTAPFAVVGTPLYMAPERYEASTTDQRSDQFSFCVALFEALYGQPPFAGETIAALRAEMRVGRLQGRAEGRAVPRWIRRVLARGLSFEPQQRFATMTALLQSLERSPWYARRQTYATAAVASLLALSAAGYARLVAHRSEICRGAAAKLQGVWDEPRRTELREAFARAAVPDAARTFTWLEKALDDYAQGWSRMYTDACEATHFRNEQSEAQLDVRMLCLERRRAELAAAVTLFADGSPSTVERSLQTASKLSPLADCASGDTLQLAFPTPVDAAQRARVEKLEAGLAQLKAHCDALDFPRAITLAEALRPVAEELGHRPALAEVYLWQGRATLHSGNYLEARRLLHESAWRAQAAKMEALAIQAWATLIWVAGTFEGDSAQAEREFRQANALLERLGAPAGLTSEVLRLWGPELHRQGRHREAKAVMLEAVSLLEQTVGPEHPNLVFAKGNLANIYAALGELEKGVALHQEVLAFSESRYGQQSRALIMPNVNLTDAFIQAGELERALPYATQALLLAERTSKDVRELAVPLLNLGELHYLRGELSRAEALYGRALSLLEAELPAGHPMTAEFLRCLGDVARGQHKVPRALTLHRRARKVMEGAGDVESREFAQVLTSLGLDLLAQKRAREAATPLERAVKLLDTHQGQVVQATAQLALAQALGKDGPDGARATALASEARATFERRGRKAQQAEAEAWLFGEKRPGGRARRSPVN